VRFSLSLAAIRDRALIHFPVFVGPLLDYDHTAVCGESKSMPALCLNTPLPF
jgi:hypothetical protein